MPENPENRANLHVEQPPMVSYGTQKTDYSLDQGVSQEVVSANPANPLQDLLDPSNPKHRTYWLKPVLIIFVLLAAVSSLIVSLTKDEVVQTNNQVVTQKLNDSAKKQQVEQADSTLNIKLDTLIRPKNSTTAFLIQNASGGSLLTADTTNTRINIVGQVIVAGSINSTSQLVAGASSLDSQSLRINNVVICDSTGCITRGGGGSASLTADQTFTGTNIFSNSANQFAGDGSALILNASNITSGVLNDGRLSANVPFLGSNNNFTGSNTFSSVSGAQLFQNGNQVCDISGNCTYSSTELTDSANLARLNANQTFTGTNLFQNATNSTTAFQIQNTDGSSRLFVADTVNSRIAVAQPTAGYTLDVGGDINSTTAIRVGGNLVCDSTGCTVASGSGYYIQNTTTLQTANFAIQSANPNDIAALIRGASGQNASLLSLVNGDSGNVVLSVANNGDTLVKNDTNSTTAFQVQDASSDTLFSVDTTNTRVNVGSMGTGTGQLYVSGITPTLVGSATAGLTAPKGIYVQGNYAYVVDESAASNRLSIFDVSNPASPTAVGSTTAGLNQPGSVYVQGKYAYVLDVTPRLSIFDVSNPASPTAVGSTTASLSNPDSIAVQGNYAYVVDSGLTKALYVYDITNPTRPALKGSYTGAPISNPQHVFISGKYAYISNGSGRSLLSFDISNPVSPSLSLNLTTCSVGQSNNASYIQGIYAYNVCNNAVYIIDLSTSSVVGTLSGGAIITPTAVFAQGKYVYVLNNADGKLVTINTSNPASPTQVAVSASGTGAPIGGLFVSGRYAYVADRLTHLNVFDLGGAYSQQFEAGGISTATLNVNGNTSIAGSGSVQGGLTVGHNLQINGNIGGSGQVLFQNATNSTAAFQVQNSSGQSLLQVDTANSNIILAGLNSGALGAWQTNATGISASDKATAVSYGGYVYILGGSTTNTAGTTSVRYAKLNADGSVGSFTSTTAMPQPLYGLTSVAASGYVFALGGCTGTSGCVNSGQTTVYSAKINPDGSLGSWVSTTPLPAARFNATSVVSNGYVYVLGGWISNIAQTTVYYAKINADGTVGSWNTSPNSLNLAVGAASSAIANGYVYVTGGQTNTFSRNNVQYAKLNSDGTTGTWTTSGNIMPTPSSYHSSVVSNGYIYSIGGGDNGGSLMPLGGSASVYYAKLNTDGSIGAWSTNTNALPAGRSSHATVSVNGYVYVFGGTASGSIQSTVYYASTSRVQIGANLDLVGLQGGNLAEADGLSQGSVGGSITAGNITAVGALQVQGSASFAQGLSVAGNLSVLGQSTFANSTDSTTALQIQNAAGASLFTADTTNLRIALGAPSATPVLLVLGTKNTVGDPSCTDGAVYYNSSSSQFRGCANSAWTQIGNNKATARVYHNTTQSIPNNIGTALSFNSERFDTDTMHDTITNNTRLVAKTAGKYIITGHVELDANATGVRTLSIMFNGSTPIAIQTVPGISGNTAQLSISTVYEFAANDYVELSVYQTSGISLNASATANYGAEFTMTRIAD